MTEDQKRISDEIEAVQARTTAAQRAVDAVMVEHAGDPEALAAALAGPIAVMEAAAVEQEALVQAAIEVQLAQLRAVRASQYW